MSALAGRPSKQSSQVWWGCEKKSRSPLRFLTNEGKLRVVLFRVQKSSSTNTFGEDWRCRYVVKTNDSEGEFFCERDIPYTDCSFPPCFDFLGVGAATELTPVCQMKEKNISVSDFWSQRDMYFFPKPFTRNIYIYRSTSALKEKKEHGSDPNHAIWCFYSDTDHSFFLANNIGNASFL